MNNIVIYSQKPLADMQQILSDIDDVEVKIVSIEQLKDYAILNPSLIIIESFDDAKDALMTNKFPCPILFFGSTRTDITVRAEGYDFIDNPKMIIITFEIILEFTSYKDKIIFFF